MKKIEITIPASTANLGPGFDVLGAGLSLYLKLELSFPTPETLLTYHGDDQKSVSLDPKINFISKIISWVGNVYQVQTAERPNYHLAIQNPIPLGRGLGSSGSASMGGIAVANILFDLNMDKRDMLDLGVMLEGHPDNIAGSLYGGWVASYTRTEIPKFQESWFEEGASVPSPKSLLGADSNPNDRLTNPTFISINPLIKCVVCIPKFTLATALSRSVLPKSYTRNQVIFNLARITILTHALMDSTLNPQVIHECMQDQIHQVQRQHLVPGLSKCINLSPSNVSGLLGTCLSGAGPTVLALATSNLDEIGKTMKGIFEQEVGNDGDQIKADYMILDFDKEGLRWNQIF